MDCPAHVKRIIARLREGGHRAVVVGGAVRDAHLGRRPKDWDLATDARPSRVAELFDRVVPVAMEKGTVVILAEGDEVEVTSFRRAGRSAFATPDEEELFGESLEEDLSARDFTLDAMAWSPEEGFVDPHDGRGDLARGVLRAVGRAEDRFAEDPLRVWRGCRLAAAYGLTPEGETERAMRVWAPRLAEIPGERIRDELVKLVAVADPRPGFEIARETGVLDRVLPELAACHGVPQNPRYHRHDVWGHVFEALLSVPPDEDFLRMAVLFHDLGKPVVAHDGHFHGHEMESARIVESRGRALKFGKAFLKRLAHVVAQHMFHYTEDMSDAALRRFIRRVGREDLPMVLALRRADRAGKGEFPDEDGAADAAADGELHRRLDEILSRENAFGIADLALGGRELMDALGMEPGPEVGRLLNRLLDWVLEDPTRNEAGALLARAREIV